ncbi:MAG: gamma carbonic anhydrase family protein [Gemmatimonadetes bacterium]|uniref:Gamma carbonic anhydrase family protein n=1 Tax=Candidatus Kutchimonas denitrificans TaxID=3056748 RepID=A0AAE5C8B7_9BACT|nr:gamma carbonic anhydrase family protein [Gemmatimonadota bacterium]NIR74341.1 gamma carbonic anhydrase family protein [Candidatus Kutchimonas denitrificans]NIS02592.1 gamma carbonic anhydrase family protein [Gemmatimonadota bacterium]NIT68467.1 gamma carbonic anhydrase family protein [Gemmatimonadota bacterium]NIU51944.1 gamma carbonic anhydrase family protein [Gemmatimonadota bacterium]
MVHRPDIHPDAFIAPGATVIGRVTVERQASIWYGTVVRGDIEPIHIGEATNIQDSSVIHIDPGLPTRIGARVGVGHRCLLHGCVVEDDCLIGMGSIVLSGAVIETGSVIAAGALITEGTRVPAGSLVIGVPAKVVRPVDDELRQRIARTIRDYRELARAHKAGDYASA